VPENGEYISGMGLDFRDFNNDGYPDIAYVALNDQTFPILKNNGKGDFEEATATSGMRALSIQMAGYGAALYDFDNDGWKDLFVTRGHSASLYAPGTSIRQPNAVFRNPGASGKWTALISEAGFADSTAARHRGCAFGDFDGSGRMDAVGTSLDLNAELWMYRSPNKGTGCTFRCAE
jgi:enediyne biosynthesis protein E4